MAKKKDEFPMVLTEGSASVKIYRGTNRGRVIFTLVYSLAGERKRQNFASLDDANVEARVVLTKLANGAAQVLTLTTGDRDAYVAARMLADKAGVSLHTMAEQYLNAHRRLNGKATIVEAVEYFTRHFDPDMPPRRPGELLEEMLAAKRKDGASEVYLKQMRLRGAKFSGDFQKPIGTITAPEIDRWLRGLNVGARSRNNFRSEITTLFSYAKRAGYLPRDRATEAHLTAKAKVTDAEVEIFTPAEVKAILGAVRKEELPFVAIAAFAGLRSAEIVRLDWADVNFAEKFIEVKAKKAKTAQRRIIPMSENLLAWLLPYQTKRGPVCKWIKTQLIVQKAAEKPVEKGGAGVTWKHNALRHSFGSYRLPVCKSAAEVALEMGNSPRMVFAHYRNLVSPSAAKAYWEIMPGPEAEAEVIPMKAQG